MLYIWQGGMTGGTGAARVLLGDVSPSGRLPDTIAYNITDYPSDKYFYDRERNFYARISLSATAGSRPFAKKRCAIRSASGFPTPTLR